MDGQQQGGDAGPRAWQGRATAAVLLLLSIAVQWPLFDRSLVPMDEGHLAAAADWMLDGRRLYADVHTGIFPGIYLVTAGLFALFGRDLLVARVAAMAVNTVSTLALWSAARRSVSPAIALLPPVLYLALVVFAFPVLSMFNYSTLALCFGLVGLVILLRYLERGRTVDGAALGLAIAASALTKQNFGALVLVALWVGLAWSKRESALASRTAFGALLPVGAAGALLTAVVTIFFAAQGTLADWLDATVVSLAGSQMSDFDNPIPPILGPHPADLRFVFLYSPPAVFNALIHGEPLAGVTITEGIRSAATRLSYGLPIALLVASLALLGRTGAWPPGPRRRATRATIVFAALFALGIFPSAIWSHLAFVMPPLLLLAALMIERAEAALRSGAGRARRRARLVWRGGGIAIGLAIGVVCVDVGRSVGRWNPEPLGLERAHVRVSTRDRALYRGAVDFVDACAAPGEPILALPDIPVIWFLTDRPNPSPYDLAIPGNVDGSLIVERMHASGVRCVVMNPQMYPEFPPFKQLFPQLARALEREFRGERVIEGGGTKWVGLVRRDQGPGRRGG